MQLPPIAALEHDNAKRRALQTAQTYGEGIREHLRYVYICYHSGRCQQEEGTRKGMLWGSLEEKRTAVGPVLICGEALEAGESAERH